jgi:carbonic anhydrase/acetyltransferase-like protein (isoleucine patch superfamily)
MNKEILEYRKTDHFLFRQWERGITDFLLYRVLPFASSQGQDTMILIVENSVIHKNHVKKEASNSKYLAVIIKENTLITCFWCQCFNPINIANEGLSTRSSMKNAEIKENNLIGINAKLIIIARYFGLVYCVNIE